MPKKINGVRVDAELYTVADATEEDRAKAELTKPDPDDDKAMKIIKAGKLLVRDKDAAK